MRLPHDWQADPYAGHCPYHSDCFEGPASRPAMNARWSRPAEAVLPEHPALELEANYIAHAMTNVICTLSPKCIILGGRVMQQPQLIPLIRKKVLALLNNSIQLPGIFEHSDETIVPPLGYRSGVLRAIARAYNIR